MFPRVNQLSISPWRTVRWVDHLPLLELFRALTLYGHHTPNPRHRRAVTALVLPFVRPQPLSRDGPFHVCCALAGGQIEIIPVLEHVTQTGGAHLGPLHA